MYVIHKNSWNPSFHLEEISWYPRKVVTLGHLRMAPFSQDSLVTHKKLGYTATINEATSILIIRSNATAYSCTSNNKTCKNDQRKICYQSLNFTLSTESYNQIPPSCPSWFVYKEFYIVLTQPAWQISDCLFSC